MGNGKIIKLGFILLIIVSLFISFACQSAEEDVSIDYEVTGTACTVDITYSDADGRIVQVLMQDISTPPPFLVTSFIVSGDEVSGFLVFLMARNVCLTAEITDTITVTIRRDGLNFLDETGVGADIVVSISGNL